MGQAALKINDFTQNAGRYLVELLSCIVDRVLQYCNAEIASNPPAGSWYAANVISDSDFSPKPLTEIFTTERSFLSTNPIVVLPSTASALVDTTTQQENFTQSSISIPPPTSDNPAPISTSTLQTTLQSTTTQAPVSSTTQMVTSEVTTSAPVQTDPPTTSSAASPPSQNPSQPLQNFFYIYPNSQVLGAPQQQPQALAQQAATTPPCATSTTTSPPPTFAQSTPSSTTSGNVPINSTGTQNTTRPFPTIRIRMLSPSGSITNINFVGGSSTIRPSTTTRRNRRRNRNNYDDCVDTCVGRRTPICAAPMGRPINPDTLKGFPTMCHLACNNSFRRNAYEKVADGRCGRVRRRIANTNLNNLGNRNQITVLANPGSFLEFQPGLINNNNL